MKLVLANSQEIPIAAFSMPLAVMVECPTVEDACDLWQDFTPEALASFSIQDGDAVLQVVVDGVLVNAQMVMNNDGSVNAHFYFDGTFVTTNVEEQPGEGEITAEEALEILTGGEL